MTKKFNTTAFEIYQSIRKPLPQKPSTIMLSKKDKYKKNRNAWKTSEKTNENSG